MKSFRDYLEDKQLDEGIISALGILAGTVFMGIPAAIWAAVGASWIITGWLKGIKKGRNKLKNIWKSFKEDLTDEEINKKIKNITSSPEVKKQLDKIEKAEEKYSNELSNVYSAIENKDWNLASEKFNSLSSSIRNNPDVVSVIINKISEVNEEPPLYTNSPGNSTYQAIKKIINIRTAKAAADATKKALG